MTVRLRLITEAGGPIWARSKSPLATNAMTKTMAYLVADSTLGGGAIITRCGEVCPS